MLVISLLQPETDRCVGELAGRRNCGGCRVDLPLRQPVTEAAFVIRRDPVGILLGSCADAGIGADAFVGVAAGYRYSRWLPGQLWWLQQKRSGYGVGFAKARGLQIRRRSDNRERCVRRMHM